MEPSVTKLREAELLARLVVAAVQADQGRKDAAGQRGSQ